MASVDTCDGATLMVLYGAITPLRSPLRSYGVICF